MEPARRTATIAGILYLVTHVTSVAALILYGPVLGRKDDATDGNTGVLVGGFLEVILALAIIGTAVTLYPVVKRQNAGVALGYVGLRSLEAATIVMGIVSLLAVVTVQNGTAGTADTAAVATVCDALVAVHDWTFLIGPGLVCGTNTVLLAYLLYRSGLVPRPIAVLGLIGGPLVLASNTAVMFGLYGQMSAPAAIAAVPIFAWELSLAGYLILAGFRTTSDPLPRRGEVRLPEITSPSSAYLPPRVPDPR